MRGGEGRMTKIQCFVHPPFRSGGCAVGVPEPPSTFWIHPLPAHGRGVLRSQVPSPPCAGMQKQKRRIPKDSPFCLGAENGTRTRAARERFRETLQTPPAPRRGVLRSQVPSPLIRRHTKRGKNLSVSSLFWSGKRISDPSIFLVHNQRIMQNIFLEGHPLDAVIMHSFASQCFRQR